MSDQLFDADRAAGTYPPRGWGWKDRDQQRKALANHFWRINSTIDPWMVNEAARLEIPLPTRTLSDADVYMPIVYDMARCLSEEGKTMPKLTEPTYEQLRKSEDENRYEAGLYHSLYDLWEKRANEYQGIIIDLFKVLTTIRDNSTDPTVTLLAKDALEAATKEPETVVSKQNEFNPERQYPGSYGALSNGARGGAIE